jgi:soluble lytic murein transglycosylase-like protein
MIGGAILARLDIMFGRLEGYMCRSKLVLAAAIAISTNTAIHAKKPNVEVRPSCPIDGTLRTADPKLLERFTALSGCSEILLIASAKPSDYVEPDGKVIIRAERSKSADLSDEGKYETIYASTPKSFAINPSAADRDPKKPGKWDKKRAGSKEETGAQSKYYSYGAASTAPSLSGTGVAVRIVPEPQPIPLETYAPVGALPAMPLGASDLSILAMRPQSFRTRYDNMIASVSNTHRIDPLFLHAVIHQESRYRSSAVSHAGATGLMQIMPATGRTLGVHPSHLTDPMTNIDAGARLLRKLHGKYEGNFELILAAYNAGEGAVAKYGNSIPPYRETQDYVKIVMKKYYSLLAEQNGVAAPQ